MEVTERVAQALKEQALTASDLIIINPSVPGGVFIPLSIGRNTAGKQIPSHKALAEVRRTLSEEGIVAEFLLIDKTAKMMEEGLRGSLLSSYPTLVRNVFLSVESGNAQIWIDSKKEIRQDEIERIEDHVRQYVALFALRGFKVYLTNENNLATNTEFLAVVRNLAPVNCESLQLALADRGFDVPSLGWINHKFDSLRKIGLLVRMPNRTYVLTADALHRLGTIKGKHSPDISRLLALARRRD